ncbi:MAG: hypothetical protein K2N65_05145 [Anaeroplasmataceae bacterium]|nr:hypothetical protein [Anaeroplasmataceae bacterium]
MYTVDLHLKNETTQTALYNLKEAISLAKRTKEHILCLIVGYGSTGGTHKIKTAVLKDLEEFKQKNQIKDYIEGSDLDIFNLKYQTLKGREWIDTECLKRKNKGEILVIL